MERCNAFKRIIKKYLLYVYSSFRESGGKERRSWTFLWHRWCLCVLDPIFEGPMTQPTYYVCLSFPPVVRFCLGYILTDNNFFEQTKKHLNKSLFPFITPFYTLLVIAWSLYIIWIYFNSAKNRYRSPCIAFAMWYVMFSESLYSSSCIFMTSLKKKTKKKFLVCDADVLAIFVYSNFRRKWYYMNLIIIEIWNVSIKENSEYCSQKMQILNI